MSTKATAGKVREILLDKFSRGDKKGLDALANVIDNLISKKVTLNDLTRDIHYNKDVEQVLVYLITYGYMDIRSELEDRIIRG